MQIKQGWITLHRLKLINLKYHIVEQPVYTYNGNSVNEYEKCPHFYYVPLRIFL